MNSSEEPTDQPINKLNTASIIWLFVIIITIILIIILFIQSSLSNDKTIFTQLKEFYGMSLTNISVALVIAFLVSNVVSSFNVYFMTPIVQSIFPGEDIWQQPIHLPRDKIMYPGLLLQAIIGFILSIGVLFIIYYIFNKIFNLIVNGKSKEIQTRIVEIIIYGFILIVYLTLLIWNAIEILQPKLDDNNNIIASSTTNQQYNIPNIKHNQSYIPINQIYIPPDYIK